MRDAGKFGAETTAAEVAEGIDLKGKVALVTGGSSGLGQETARVLASRGAEVILTARDVPKGEAVAAGIRASTGNQSVAVAALELGSLAQIREFAAHLRERHPKIDIVVNNAGVMACPFSKTTDGFEMQFGSNHVGHFLMTCLLIPSLRAPARIVSVSSRGHHFSPVVFDDLNFEKRPYDKWQAYGQSKTANILFAVGLEKRLGKRGIHAFSLHPGGIMTELARHLQMEDIEMLRARNRGAGMKFKTVEAGSATSVFAATAPELDGKGGEYLEDCHIAAVNDSPEALSGVRSYALDPENAERLWQVSEKLVGQTFSLA